jgi:hypothetical protein
MNVHGFEDIIATDHTLISFDVDFKICKKPKVKPQCIISVYNFKNANWSGLNQVLANIPFLFLIILTHYSPVGVSPSSLP